MARSKVRRLDFLGDIDLDSNIGLARFASEVRNLLVELYIHTQAAGDELEARLATRPAKDGVSAASRAKRVAAPLASLADSLEGLEKKPRELEARFMRLFEQELTEARNHKKAQFRIVPD